jgi:hypothetical protein
MHKICCRPFSYSIFLIALIKALLYVAPLINPRDQNEKAFSFSLCDWLSRENVNLKSTTQNWKESSGSDDGQSHKRLLDDYSLESAKVFLKDRQTNETSLKLKLSQQLTAYCQHPSSLSTMYSQHTRTIKPLVFGQQQKKQAAAATHKADSKRKRNNTQQDIITSYIGHQIGRSTVPLALVICSMIFVSSARTAGKSLRSGNYVAFLLFLGMSENGLVTATELEQQQQSPQQQQELLNIFLVGPAVLVVTGLVLLFMYTMFCCWLSISWLHFAKAFVTKKREAPLQDIEAAHPLGARTFPNEQTHGSMKHSLIREVKFKTHVLHDALIMYSTLFNPASLRTVIYPTVPAAPATGARDEE